MRTSTPPSWADLAGLRVGVWGLGVEGLATVARLRDLGTVPAVVADDRPDGRHVDGIPVVATAEALDELDRCDVVVKSPGISRYRPEAEALRGGGVLVTNGLALWLNGAERRRVACITGSKGKSTTTSIAGHLARGLGARVFVGGNLGLPPFAPEAAIDVDLWLVETSSYQAADLAVSPAVTAVTSLSPDHLPWHDGSVERYYADKLSLCQRPGAEVTVAAADDPEVLARQGALAPRVRLVEPVGTGGWADHLDLPGRHNRSNAAVAAAVLDELGVAGADDPGRLAVAAEGFAGLPSRLCTVARLDDVAFVDDSLSTNVLPTIAAVDAFTDRRVALLLGGQERDLDYRLLADHLQGVADGNRPLLAIAMTDTETGVRMAATISTHAPEVELVEAGGLGAAVATGLAFARPDGVVLLSPAAPSLGMYENYAARARAFTAAAVDLGATPARPPGRA